ncbi:nicotinate-nucleotide--dimethylbenzimidazole phosphoribosyltransferase [Photobacterium gaetbulicola]|uniref:Nicotinate-nucleotide--dimethylbenzimidazole phosphoribosyltransferase n=1 Tax=Photobacterium gaetbulicola Gung47 TaxID=658445 RepID=A0A0C5WRE5_9GAMM|nr:nicotinate-nucleotide--dimethylbenzimidazole phosphoribosyltransferase [Photobacterium gaetbulicola]AJR08917.1 nicotinate-nucleotide--dimethylbenzimidazole phosphoribosyltransferase [Photobacterium gaetbulicola Gung47]PSU13470.1 nicotinate-nucleotide--dimethylbenzimidazole phosphoribosyltransferase [Photobacterium gaetbulicola]
MFDTRFSAQIQERIDQKTKPLGALGQLEKLAHQLALIQSQGKADALVEITLEKPTVLVFAGDHGIAEEGVSIAPSAVTQQMVLNFLAGGAAVNCFCRANEVAIKVIDCGILLPVELGSPLLIQRRLGERTGNLATEPAMTQQQVQEGIVWGQNLVEDVINQGCNLVMFGEMGIGNTSSASALLAAVTGEPAERCVGFGTGVTTGQLEKKKRLVSQGVARCDSSQPLDLLAELGGFEIVQMVGGFLAAAKHRTPVLVDGFIVTVAALVATKIDPNCRDYLIFAHQSHESGHRIALEHLDAEPLLDLSLRLGEGTGAVLAVPLLRAAAEFYNNMASFTEAGVTV